METLQNDIKPLVEAAHKLRDLVKQLSVEDLPNVKGFIIYRQESEEEIQMQKQEQEKLKLLIQQNNPDAQVFDDDEEDQSMVNEQTAAIIQKFKGKILKEFIPVFMLKQYAEDSYIEYDSFCECVDEYFS